MSRLWPAVKLLLTLAAALLAWLAADWLDLALQAGDAVGEVVEEEP